MYENNITRRRHVLIKTVNITKIRERVGRGVTEYCLTESVKKHVPPTRTKERVNKGKRVKR